MDASFGPRLLMYVEGTSYPLILLPWLTDFMETGRWPRGGRDLITEGLVGLVLLLHALTIRQARRRVERLEKDRRTLTSILLRDMKNPIANVIAALSRLEEHPEDLSRRALIKSSIRSCRQDLDLMNQLLDADRLEEKELSVVKRPVYVPELLRSCAEEISPTTFARNIAFSCSHSPDVE